MMQREESVTYSSLPQEEGVTPRSTFVTSRSASNPHNRRDIQLTAILVTVVIVTGLTLAITLPLVLKGNTSKDLGEPADQSSDHGKDEGNEDLLGSLLHVKGDKNDTFEDYDHINEEELGGDQGGNVTSASNNEEAPMHAINFTATKSPLPPATVAATIKVTLPKVNETTPPFAVSGASMKEEGHDVPSEEEASEASLSGNMTTMGNGGMDSMMSGQGEEESWGKGDSVDSEVGGYHAVTEDGDPPNFSGSGEGSLTSAKSEINQIPPTQAPGDEKYEIDMNQLLNEIYGEQGSAKPITIEDSDPWTTDILSTQDKVTMVVLAAVVAVALAAVIMAVGWLVYARVAARRRRINIQNVITDLQSRDKIVLLNSEESEEE